MCSPRPFNRVLTREVENNLNLIEEYSQEFHYNCVYHHNNYVYHPRNCFMQRILYLVLLMITCYGNATISQHFRRVVCTIFHTFENHLQLRSKNRLHVQLYKLELYEPYWTWTRNLAPLLARLTGAYRLSMAFKTWCYQYKDGKSNKIVVDHSCCSFQLFLSVPFSRTVLQHDTRCVSSYSWYASKVNIS